MNPLDKYEIKEGNTYSVVDYANDIFTNVKIIKNNSITGDIAYKVIDTNEVFYFSGQGFFTQPINAVVNK